MKPWRMREAQVVSTPAVVSTSFRAMGRPRSGPLSPAARRCVGCGGLFQCEIGGDGEVGADAAVHGLDAIEQGLGEFDRTELPRAQAVRGRVKGEAVEVVGH